VVNKVEEHLLRTRGTMSFHQDAYTDYFDNLVEAIDDTQQTGGSQSVFTTAIGDDNPSWRSQLAAGLNVVGNYERSSTRWESGQWKAESEWFVEINPPPKGRPVYNYKVELEPDFPTVTFPAPNDEARQAALGPFISKCNQRITQFSTGQFVGELRETIQLLKRPMEGIRNILNDHLHDLKRNRSKRRSKGDKKKFLADKWLTASFGILPLVNDIQDAARATARLVEDLPPPAKVSSSASSEEIVFESEIGFPSYGPTTWGTSSIVKDVNSCRYFAGVILENEGGTPRNVVGIRPDLFIPTVWELIPYSWLVDYFSNVGQVIEAACFNTSRLKYWGLTTKSTRIVQIRNHGDFTNAQGPGYKSSSASGSPSKMETQVFTRARQPNLVPNLSFSIPTRWSKWANMSAVAVMHSKLVPY
jgi:hypothetical protein